MVWYNVSWGAWVCSNNNSNRWNGVDSSPGAEKSSDDPIIMMRACENGWTDVYQKSILYYLNLSQIGIKT